MSGFQAGAGVCTCGGIVGGGEEGGCEFGGEGVKGVLWGWRGGELWLLGWCGMASDGGCRGREGGKWDCEVRCSRSGGFRDVDG